MTRHRVAEHVRMPPHKLLLHAPRDRLEVTSALLFEQQRQEVRLEEEVAELVDELRRVAVTGCLGNLVRLLDGVRDDCQSGLLTIPGAVPAKSPGQLLEREQGLREALLRLRVSQSGAAVR